jgi:hypothetical protein
MNEDILFCLQEWFSENYSFIENQALSITTIDNPGYGIIYKLGERPYKPFQTIDLTRSEEDWIYCAIKHNQLQAACGIKNLTEMLQIFVNWFGNCKYQNINSRILSWLQKWSVINADGDWEHSKNFSIITTNVPGWEIFINLSSTVNLNGILLENKVYKVTLERSKDNWIYAEINNNTFEAKCGPKNLIETLEIFINWAGNQK